MVPSVQHHEVPRMRLRVEGEGVTEGGSSAHRHETDAFYDVGI